MIRIEPGMHAKSLAGHDRGKIYRIIRVESEYVWLVNGTSHMESKPKKKNKKHIQVIQSESQNWQEDKQCRKQM